uniref:Uncharacterized protein n=1 Tax=uncultured Desulfobacterium sp. TaxID=201089 RepID=E1Y8U3_9BACT|nr:unknown protein [uncultured Desulfobacterium sp.]
MQIYNYIVTKSCSELRTPFDRLPCFMVLSKKESLKRG